MNEVLACLVCTQAGRLDALPLRESMVSIAQDRKQDTEVISKAGDGTRGLI